MNFEIVETQSTTSTNADLAVAAMAGAPEGTVHSTLHQTAGRGRLDRQWQAPPGSGLAVSVLLRPRSVPDQRWTWLPLLAGVAAAEAIGRTSADLAVRLKWPNDVEIGERKVAGILVERVETPQGPAAVVGIGVNIAMTDDQLPVPTATSLAIEGVAADRSAVLETLLQSLGEVYGAWVETSGDPAGGLHADYLRWCGTVGENVEVSLSDGTSFRGQATDVDDFGRLIVDGRPVSAGDVTRVRR